MFIVVVYIYNIVLTLLLLNEKCAQNLAITWLQLCFLLKQMSRKRFRPIRYFFLQFNLLRPL